MFAKQRQSETDKEHQRETYCPLSHPAFKMSEITAKRRFRGQLDWKAGGKATVPFQFVPGVVQRTHIGLPSTGLALHHYIVISRYSDKNWGAKMSSSMKLSPLRKARLNKGLSQSDLAAMSGVTQSAIAMYEKGERNVTKDISDSLARALGINQGDFFAFYNSMQEFSGALKLPSERLMVLVQQVHLDTIDLMDALGNVLGEKERDDLLKEDLSGLKDALMKSREIRIKISGDLDPRAQFFQHWINKLDEECVEIGFSSLSEIQRIRAAARARWFDYLQHGN